MRLAVQTEKTANGYGRRLTACTTGGVARAGGSSAVTDGAVLGE